MNNLSISTLAIDARLLASFLVVAPIHGVNEVEIAPSQHFVGGMNSAYFEQARSLRDLLDRRGIRCCALQGIMHGTKSMSLFRSTHERTRLHAHLDGIAYIASILGAKVCVFGAPKIRDIKGLTQLSSFRIATNFFREVALRFEDRGIILAFEPVSRQYGCNFGTHTLEAAALVDEVDKSGFRLNLDVGTMLLGEEEASDLRLTVPLAAHLHVSEPDLRPLKSTTSFLVQHQRIAAELAQNGYRGTVSIEQKNTTPETWETEVAEATQFVQKIYLTRLQASAITAPSSPEPAPH